MLSTAASYVSMFFSFLSGKSTYTRAILKNKVADLDENLFKIGADSLLAARFVAAINARCGIEVRMKEVFMNPSINALTKLVDKRKNTDIAEFVEEGEI